MDINTFCSLYEVPKSTVYRKIDKYKDTVLKGHIQKESKKATQLDAFAVEFLSPKVMPGQGVEDVLTRIENIETDGRKKYEELSAGIAELSRELAAFRSVFDDYRRVNDEKSEQAVIKSAMAEEKAAAAENNSAGCQEQLREMSGQLAETADKVTALAAKKGIFG